MKTGLRMGLVVAVAVAVVAMLAWWPGAPARKPPAAAGTANHAPPADVDSLTGPRTGVVPQPMASASRSAARVWITRSRHLQACAQLLSRSDDELVTDERRIAASWPEIAGARGATFDARAAERELQDRITIKLDDRRACQALPAAEIASWWTLLERAALAGDLVAMEDYGRLVVNASARADDMFDDIDEMARRKKLAYGFLRQVAAQGNCMVSGSLERVAPDAPARHAFALVSVEVTRRFNDQHNPEATANNVAFMQREADRRGSRLAPAELAQARRLAAEVIGGCR